MSENSSREYVNAVDVICSPRQIDEPINFSSLTNKQSIYMSKDEQEQCGAKQMQVQVQLQCEAQQKPKTINTDLFNRATIAQDVILAVAYLIATVATIQTATSNAAAKIEITDAHRHHRNRVHRHAMRLRRILHIA